MTSLITTLFFLELTLRVATVQYQAPPLTVRVTAPSPRELLLTWDPPTDVTGLKHYTLTSRDVLEDKKTVEVFDANTTSHRLTDLMANGSYTIQVTWTGDTTSSAPATLTVRPIEVYRAAMEERDRPPAMLIFYGIIGSASLLYGIVVLVLVVYFCRKRRRNSSTFTVTQGRAGKLSSLFRTTTRHDTLNRYSTTESLQTNRVSTFTGNRNTVNKPPASSADNTGYERPFSIDYLHPLPAAVPEEPPPLPERSTTKPDEPHYEEPDEIRVPTKKPHRGSRNKAKAKTESLPDADMAAPSATVKQNRSMAVATSKIPSAGSDRSLTSSSLPVKSGVTAQRNGNMEAPSTPMPVKSSATVHRNESMKSVTIRTEVDAKESMSCPDMLGRDLVEAAEEGFQITLTLRSNPKTTSKLENAYILMK